jgi:Fe-S-cluster containining protein
MDLDNELSHIKTVYREIFTSARESLFAALNASCQDFTCPDCSVDAQANALSEEILTPRHAGCGYRAWQSAGIRIVETDIARQVLERMNLIEYHKKQAICSQCGVCCRLASSEFSYEELLRKADQGDAFAQQFTGVFLPYASQEDAEKRFPDLVSQVVKYAESGKEVHFYHCPYIGEDNRCSIYTKRPQICRSYPDTPLTFIYDHCAWKPWKDQSHPDALWAHAMIELCTFTLAKLHEATDS